MSIDPIIPSSIPERSWLEVDLNALVANARRLMELGGRPLLPMVKANAYGLGAVQAVRALESVEPWGYGVVTVAEAAELRNAGIRRPIVVFAPLRPDSAEACVRLDLRPVICDGEALDSWIPTNLPFHIEIDTGMARTGIRWDQAGELAPRLAALRAGQWEGIFTHLHSPDEDPATVAVQRTRLEEAIGALGSRPSVVHVANSAGIVTGSIPADEDVVRPGIYLYGGRAGSEAGQTVARFCAPIIARRRLNPGETVSYGAEWMADRPTWIGTIAGGYADGIPRQLGNRGAVEVAGRVVPIVGRIAMDFTMIDLGDSPASDAGFAVVWGGLVSLDEQAGRAGTIGYELLTMVGPRVARHYRELS